MGPLLENLIAIEIKTNKGNKMTTAHRPTFNAAFGGSMQGGNKVAAPR